MQSIDLVTTTVDGGSVTTELGYGIKINERSSLRRSWIYTNDPTCPLQIENVGITTSYKDNQFRLNATGVATAKDAVSAFEIRILMYDVFGEHIRTLSIKDVSDCLSNRTVDLTSLGGWRAWDNDALELMNTFSFVAKVKYMSGLVWTHNENSLSHELSKVNSSAQRENMKPTKSGG